MRTSKRGGFQTAPPPEISATELNETAQEIVTRCDGRPLSEIVLGLAREYDADLEMLAADVRETLADLQRRKLIKLA